MSGRHLISSRTRRRGGGRRMLAARVSLAALVAALAALAAGCGGGNEGGGGGEGGAIELGAALSLTGSISREGILTKQGYELCKQVVNQKGGVPVGDKKHKLAISYQDDTSEPDVAARLVDQFNDKDVKLILGPYGSSATEAASAVTERNGQVMVDSAGADNAIFAKGYQRIFAVLSPASEYAASIVKAVQELGNPQPKTVAVLTADDGFSKQAAQGGIDAAKEAGWTVFGPYTYPESSTDISSQLTKVRPNNPDLIIESGHLEEGIAAVKQSAELGIKPMGFGETVAPPTPDFRETLGARADGVLGSSQWVPQVKGQDKYFGTAQNYVKLFQDKYGTEPEYHNAEASAACLAFALAIEKAGSTDPDAVRDALAGLDTESFFGPITFDDTGKNVTKPMAVIQIQSGKVVTVWPKEAAEAELQWPATR
jgi:branched-chain amino acid transport system substrate-binding protein